MTRAKKRGARPRRSRAAPLPRCGQCRKRTAAVLIAIVAVDCRNPTRRHSVGSYLWCRKCALETAGRLAAAEAQSGD